MNEQGCIALYRHQLKRKIMAAICHLCSTPIIRVTISRTSLDFSSSNSTSGLYLKLCSRTHATQKAKRNKDHTSNTPCSKKIGNTVNIWTHESSINELSIVKDGVCIGHCTCTDNILCRHRASIRCAATPQSTWRSLRF